MITAPVQKDNAGSKPESPVFTCTTSMRRVLVRNGNVSVILIITMNNNNMECMSSSSWSQPGRVTYQFSTLDSYTEHEFPTADLQRGINKMPIESILKILNTTTTKSAY